MYIVLVYDILTDEAGIKILPKVFKECKKFLVPIQKSTFEGELTDSQFVELRGNLEKYVRKNKDSVIVFKSRDKKWLKKEFWGMGETGGFNFI